MLFKRESAGVIETLIGATVTVRGDLEFTGGLQLEGRVLGHVRVLAGKEGSLSLTETAMIDGDVQATQGTINGHVRGDVRITGRLALGPAAVIEGNVEYGTVEMQAGARISGRMQNVAPAA